MYATYCRLNLPLSATNIDVIRAARIRLLKGAYLQNKEGVKSFYKAMVRYHNLEKQRFFDCKF